MNLPDDWMSTSRLLLIDDNPDNLSLLQRMLEWAGFTHLFCFTNASKALQSLGDLDPDLIVLDLMMPEMDGYEFLRRLELENTTHLLPVLVFTADLTPEARTKALNLGASDFLTKPGDAIEIQLRVRNFLRMRKMHHDLEIDKRDLEAKVVARTRHLDLARREAVEVLARACEYRDDQTGQHARRVGETSAAIAVELGLDSDYVESLRLAALLHDIGKIAVPDELLFKPSALTPPQAEVMKSHVLIGGELFSDASSPLLQMAKEIALYHHESYDGQGYCSGFKGDQIPLSARIVAVADAFDAMTNDRPYRRAQSSLRATEELQACSGKQFDPRVVTALIRVLARQSPPVSRAA